MWQGFLYNTRLQKLFARTTAKDIIVSFEERGKT